MKNYLSWILRRLLFLPTVLLPLTAFANVERPHTENQRHCIGLLWCTEQSAQGQSVDGLLWLYSTEERGNYSRLAIRPFYSIEEDPTRDLLRRSFFWPLGTYERRADSTWAHVVPFYWHSERPGHEWTFAAPLYLASTDGDVSWKHLLPLVSRQRMGDYYARNYVLGPVFISTSDTRRDLLEWDLLFPLVHHHADRDSSHTRVAPIYWSGEDRRTGDSYLYILPFFGSSDSPAGTSQFLFPLYGRADDSAANVHRFTMLGLPPAKGLSKHPTLSLFERVASAEERSHRLFPLYRAISSANGTETLDALLLYRHRSGATGMLDRFFPLYRYENDTVTQTREFDVLGYGPVSWYRYQAEPGWSQHRLFGLYSSEHYQNGSSIFSAIGHRRFSLYFHRNTEQVTEDYLVPLYDYFRSGESRALSLLGVSTLSLYRQESSPSLLQHRLFPIYRYRHDLANEETDFDALLLYRHLISPTKVADRLLPFWDYAGTTATPSWRLSLLGMDALALYRHDRDEVRTLDHLFPLYGYRSESGGDTRITAIGMPPLGRSSAWSLYEHVTSPTTVTDRLFPVYRYAHDESTVETTINVLGGEHVSLFRSHRNPTEKAQHAFPLYSYHANYTMDTQSLSALWLFWRTSSPTATRTTLFPLGSVSTNDETDERTWSLIGLDPWIPISWIRHSGNRQESRGHVVPIYDYHRDEASHTLSIGGVSQLALYQQQESPTASSRRLFPLFGHSHDRVLDISQTSILMSYWHEQAPEYAIDTLIPFWRYERHDAQHEQRFNALGIGSVSLYEHYNGPSTTSDRLFPLYNYASNQETGGAELSVLWPLAQYQSQQGRMTSASLLWWLIAYDRPDEAHSNFHALGGSRMAMIRRVTSPEASIFEINPILPGFRYRSEVGGSNSWDLFYGLVGTDSTRERTRVKLFWVTL